MRVPRVSRTGAVAILLVFLLLAIEDVYIWVTAGAVPGIEFFAGIVLVAFIWVLAIREAQRNRPP